MVTKINNYLSKTFLVALVITQAILFVSVKAQLSSDLLVQFINPAVGQEIIIGESIMIQAYITGNSRDLATVYFVLRSEDNSMTSDLLFQATRDNGASFWTADSTWNTSGYTAGTYYLSVSGTTYDERNNIISFSQEGEQVVILAADNNESPNRNAQPNITPTASIISPTSGAVISGTQYEVIVEAEINPTDALQVVLQQNNNDIAGPYSADSNNGSQYSFLVNTTEADNGQAIISAFITTSGTDRQQLAEVSVNVANENISDPPPPTEPTVPEALDLQQVISPTSTQATISGNNYPIEIQLNRSLLDSESVGATLYLIGQSTSHNINLTLTSGGTYKGRINTLELVDGNYQLVLWYNNGQRSVFTNDYYLTISNSATDDPLPAEPISPADYDIILLQPTGVITTDQFIISLETNFSAVSLNLGISRTDDTAISVSHQLVRTGSGQSWTKNITLNREVFVNGQYNMLVTTTDSASEDYQESFLLTLNLAAINQPTPPAEPEDDDGDVPPANGENESAPEQNQTPESPEAEDDNSDLPPITEPEDDDAQSDDEESGSGSAQGQTNMDPLCVENQLTQPDDCLRWLALFSEDIDDECLAEGIYDSTACEDYLNRVYVDFECQSQGIIELLACQDYLVEKYTSGVVCRLSDQNLCQNVLRRSYLNRLVIRQQQQDKVELIIRPLIGRAVETAELYQSFNEQNINNILPIITRVKNKVLVINSRRQTTLVDEQNLAMTSAAVLALDNDGDGLPNDLENYYQTDIDNPDSDGDSFLDGEEINNGYDPLGEGRLNRVRTDFDKVILSGLSLEQPTASNQIDDSFVVNEAVSQVATEGVAFRGQARPNTWVTIYLYSDLPLVMLAKTDDSGNWSYVIQNSLTDGEHQVYVTINDDTGKIIKQSEPLSFLVRGAQAVTASEYFSAAPEQDQVDSLVLYYILGAAFLILLALGVLVFIHRDRGEKEIENS